MVEEVEVAKIRAFQSVFYAEGAIKGRNSKRSDTATSSDACVSPAGSRHSSSKESGLCVIIAMVLNGTAEVKISQERSTLILQLNSFKD